MAWEVQEQWFSVSFYNNKCGPNPLCCPDLYPFFVKISKHFVFWTTCSNRSLSSLHVALQMHICWFIDWKTHQGILVRNWFKNWIKYKHTIFMSTCPEQVCVFIVANVCHLSRVFICGRLSRTHKEFGSEGEGVRGAGEATERDWAKHLQSTQSFWLNSISIGLFVFKTSWIFSVFVHF